METRIIKAVFGASKSIVAPKRYKHDYGQGIEFVGIDLPNVFEAHFSNSKSGQAKKQIGQDNVVTVPDEYFVSGADIFCWVMVHDEATDGRTMYTVRIPVMERPEPIDVEPTPVQQDVIAQAITALNDAVAQTAEDVQAADASAQSASDSADRAETARDTAEGYAQQAQASASNASASATASANSASQAQRIKTDVESMVDEAQSAAGASAQSASESAQSASQASASATSASQSAETASTKASEASASAQTAGAKATEASEYASTASAKASEASQSASAASGHATQAGQAKTAAETAQGLAEQAQSDAESAKDDAESARDEAQQIVGGISGKVEQIDQNTADIAGLEADRYKAYATDTATGAVASSPDGADNIPMVDVLVNIAPVQDLSHGDPSPDNICPISGWAGCNVSRVGVNVWDEEWEVGGIRPQDGALINEQRIRSKNLISCVPNTTYYILDPTNDENIRVFYYAKNGSYIGCTSFIMGAQTTPNNARFMRFIVATTYGTTYNHDIGINYPSTDHDYHPYTGQAYPITFPTEAGTVYGGELDVTTGALTVDRAMVTLDGSESWNLQSINGYGIANFNTTVDHYPAVNLRSLCNMIPSQTSLISSTETEGYLVHQNGSTVYIRLFSSRASTVAELKIWLASNPIQLVYTLATPITYTLTPTEIKSLLGDNNIWADAGDTTVVYRADTAKYIDKKIAEVINALS